MGIQSKVKQEDRANVVGFPPLIYLLAFVLGILLHFLRGVQIATNFNIVLLVGAPLIILAIVLMIWALQTFKKAGEDKDVRTATHSIVTSGPFAFTRNPMYLAMIILYVGFAIIINTLWPFLFLPIVIIIMYYGVILREEKYLEKKFGDKYIEYKKRVRRWI